MGAAVDGAAAEAGMGEQAEGDEVNQGLARIDQQLDSDQDINQDVKRAKMMPKKPLKKSMKPKVQKISIETYVIKGK